MAARPHLRKGRCAAAYSRINSSNGGYQGQVRILAVSAATSGWTVRWTLGSGRTGARVWKGSLSAGGSDAAVTDASSRGSILASGSAALGFLANGIRATLSLT